MSTSVSPSVDANPPRQPRASEVALPPWLVNSQAFGAVIADDAGTILFANDAFAASLGFGSADAVIGENLIESFLLEKDDWAAWRAGGEHQFRLRHLNGSAVTFCGEVGASRDRSRKSLHHCVLCEQRSSANTEQLFEHAARMEAVAGLSSGIAHDFNNLLTVLVGNLYLLGEELRDNKSAFTRIKAARDTALRGSELTKQLLNYARADETDESEVKPAAVVSRLQPLLEKLVGARIRMHVDISVENYTVAASRAQLESAIVNLVINARDAIDGSGTIRVGVHEDAAPNAAGTHVILSVSDDGPGMPADVMQRVFEPFFTTKGDVGGTGLGLSMVRWFAESASGRVEIKSSPGSGTAVSVILPQLDRASGDTTCSKTLPLSVLPSGDERIALLIDDAEMRAMTQQTLTVLGYDVQHSSSLEIARNDKRSDGFDLVVIDADNREDLVAMVDNLSRTSRARVLALTARNITELDQEAQLRKPFSLIELAGGVRGVLDGESVSG